VPISRRRPDHLRRQAEDSPIDEWPASAKVRGLTLLLPLPLWGRGPGKRNWLSLLSSLQPTRVMPGLVPGISRRMQSIRPHAEPPTPTSKVPCNDAAWMTGTSRAMTRSGSTNGESSADSGISNFPRTALPLWGRVGVGVALGYPKKGLRRRRPRRPLTCPPNPAAADRLRRSVRDWSGRSRARCW
jgi:hypothetical protein